MTVVMLRAGAAMQAHDGHVPAVSVIVPVFNRATSVARVMHCLRRQSLRDWEVVFVDDGSDIDLHDAVAPFFADARVRCIRLARNAGASAARNRGVAAARGRYVAFLDSDDDWHPDKLVRQVAVMDRLPNAANSFCVTLTEVRMPGGWQRVRPNFAPRPGTSFGDYLYVQGGFAQVSSLLLPRSLALAHGFRETLRQYEDHLLFIELQASGADYIVVPEVLTVWHNDARPDRLSRRDDLGRGEAFLAAATDLLDPGVKTAFRLRALGGVLIRRRPREAVMLAVSSLWQRVLSPRQVTLILARHVMPPRLWQRLIRPAP